MKNVAIGLLGTNLDRGEGEERWSQWRPSVSLFQHEDLLINRFELLYQENTEKLAKQIASDIQWVSPETQVNVHKVEFKDPWDFEDVYGVLHDFARSYAFDTDREDYLFHITTGTHVAQICAFLLTESRHFPCKLIQTSPPKQRNSDKPGRFTIIDLDRSKYDRIAQRFANEQREGTAFLKAGIETRNAAFNQMIDEIEHVAINSRSPILLTGPTGAGKSSLARRIYELKKLRREITGPFVEVNCATIRGDGAMSALFGHKRGAFTGAMHDRAGLLREANKGMLFLDEIGELRVDEQAMLLQAIEARQFFPVGSDRLIDSDFQLICGTNRDLLRGVMDGRFRDDLLARINLWSFELPSLANRREDIEPNIKYELAQFTGATGRTYRFNKEAMERFLQFSNTTDAIWAGNFRDLSAAIARMATMAPSGRITRDVVENEIGRLCKSWNLSDRRKGSPKRIELESILGDRINELDEFDCVQLEHVVRVCRESKSLSDAGRKLFTVSRKQRKVANDADRLRKYLARFSLDWSTVSASQ